MFRPALASLLLASALGSAPAAQGRPKLVVVISVDQFSAELMQTYGPELTGGLARLRKEGVAFTEAYQDHGFTETGPGHSVLLSGRFPANTGIVENRWVNRATGKFVYCVEDSKARALHAPGHASASNALFLGDALGDWLQAQVPGSRAFAVSGKDRAAILMAGRKPTGAFWFTGSAGFTSSTAYGDHLPEWLLRYDRGLSERIHLDSWLWSKDPATPEGRSAQWTYGAVTVRNGALPRLIQGAGMPVDRSFESRFRSSPFLDVVTLEAAEALLEGEKLGHGPGTDLLAVSFSATDYIGHSYGTLGTEMRDQMHRLDRVLGRLLERLHREQPDAWVVLSADHGGLDIPEALAEQGFPARRLHAAPFLAALQADLRAAFKAKHDLLGPASEPTSLYLDEAAVKAARLDRREVLGRVQAWLRARPEVADAFTAEELAATDPATTGSPRDSSLRVLLRRSFHPERSGDILVAVKPFVVLGTPPTDYPANHGTPNAYDRRVPLIFWGPWQGGERREPVRTVDLAPTLARELGLVPGPVDGKALDLGPRK
jgi:predicted AlkP superfamily pyrophosphatase or phosphodiesterase